MGDFSCIREIHVWISTFAREFAKTLKARAALTTHRSIPVSKERNICAVYLFLPAKMLFGFERYYGFNLQVQLSVIELSEICSPCCGRSRTRSSPVDARSLSKSVWQQRCTGFSWKQNLIRRLESDGRG